MQSVRFLRVYGIVIFVKYIVPLSIQIDLHYIYSFLWQTSLKTNVGIGARFSRMDKNSFSLMFNHNRHFCVYYRYGIYIYYIIYIL